MALALFVVASAAAVTIITKPLSGEGGTHTAILNNLISMDKGFMKAGSTTSATGTCPSAGNVTFSSSPQTASNGIAIGDIFFDAQVNTTSTTPTISCFTVTLALTLGSGPPTTYSVKVATGSSVSAGWIVDCKFDVGTSLPTSPFSFKVTVQ